MPSVTSWKGQSPPPSWPGTARTMKRVIDHLPELLIVAAGFGLWLHGPILQLPHYNDFADQRALLGINDGANVLSNVGFAAVGLWGLWRLWPARQQTPLAKGWPGYSLFLISLVLTALGSGFYHMAPDNSRLIWDRLPIALACAGLLAAATRNPGRALMVATSRCCYPWLRSLVWCGAVPTKTSRDCRWRRSCIG